jgi:hypothetical protein
MTTAPLHPGWRVQLAVHRAVRRDLGRLSAALDGERETPPEAIQTYWGVTASQLHEHHVFEDTVVWPLLGQRLGGRVDSLLTRNAQEHQTMATAMERFGDTLVGVTIDAPAARVALKQLNEAVEDHLADEEADVLPLIPDAFTVEDVAAFAAESAKTNPAEAFLPWVLDGAPDSDVAFFTGQLPAPVRTALESLWVPLWRAKVDALGR